MEPTCDKIINLRQEKQFDIVHRLDESIRHIQRMFRGHLGRKKYLAEQRLARR